MAEPGKPDRNPSAEPVENVAVSHLLIVVAAAFLPTPAPDDAAIADVLGELLVILHDRHDLSRGVYPPRGHVKPLSRPLARLEAALVPVVRRYRDLADAGSTSVLPASLEDGTTRAGAVLQVPRTSPQDVIDLDQMAALLGLRSREGARWLVRKHKLASWANPDGRHETLVYRSEVIALREQRSGDDGIGGREERPGDPGRAAGSGSAGRDRAA